MSNLQQTAQRLREQEAALQGSYQELAGAASRDMERNLIAQTAKFQHLQLVSLDLLLEGVPDQFLGLGRVLADDVNLREGPGARYPLVGQLRAGDFVVIRAHEGLWVEIQVPKGPSGFVFKDYVSQETTA